MSDVKEIELSLEHAKGMVDLKRSVERLTNNRDFKKVILDGYFKDEAVRLSSIAGDPLFAKDRADIFLAIQGISSLYGYMQRVVRMGEIAEREVKDYLEELDDIRGDEGGDQ